MFRILGNLTSRRWPFFLLGWVIFISCIKSIAPEWQDVIKGGEFSYLPEDYPSRRAENLFTETFSRNFHRSSIVVVVRRESHPQGLQPRDREFIRKVLNKRLVSIAQEKQFKFIDETLPAGKQFVRVVSRILTPYGSKDSKESEADEDSQRSEDDEESIPLVSEFGDLLVSEDGMAALVVLELRTEFRLRKNQDIVDRIEKLISKTGEFHDAKNKSVHIPAGLDLTLSGSATVGRDMRVAAQESADATRIATLVLVVVLLLIIYRAPFLVLIPILTVVVSVEISLSLLAMLADAGYVGLFTSIDIYVKVVMYGAGIDYCMFLMARYKEELDGGATFEEAISAAVDRVGPALAASAGTTMAGIGMMVFAEFGKFQQAGVAMSFSLFFVLMASLTLAPAMLRLAGRWAFWPYMRSERIPATGGWLSPTSLVSRLIKAEAFRGVWDKVGRKVQAQPWKVWLTCLAVMTPFAIVGIVYFNHLSFGLLSELPDDNPSVVGTRAVQGHFSAGATGPVKVLIKNSKIDFSTPEGVEVVRKLSFQLESRRQELGIADIRSVANPFGTTAHARAAEAKTRKKAYADAHEERFEKEREERKPIEREERLKEAYAKEEKRRNRKLSIFERNGVRSRFRRRFPAEFEEGFKKDFDKEFERRFLEKSQEKYISDKGELAQHVTRMDIVFVDDPFSRGMIARFDKCKSTIRDQLPNELAKGTELFYIGSTPSIRDLKTVTGRDLIRIDVLVIVGVFLILVVLLRRTAISGYLILSVFFSYLVTLGVTFAVFWAIDPAGFAGLDWKVPMFLFTILIAVGEDYNIYLMTRIHEEQQIHGLVEGVTVALSRTGSIISSCGFIMAGTFSSLMVGSLAGMQQLGFALAFGVLLDTFVVRPILVPSYLVLLHSGRFGALGKFLGATPHIPAKPDPALKVGADTVER